MFKNVFLAVLLLLFLVNQYIIPNDLNRSINGWILKYDELLKKYVTKGKLKKPGFDSIKKLNTFLKNKGKWIDIDGSKTTIYLSNIFKWCKEDFGNDAKRWLY